MIVIFFLKVFSCISMSSINMSLLLALLLPRRRPPILQSGAPRRLVHINPLLPSKPSRQTTLVQFASLPGANEEGLLKNGLHLDLHWTFSGGLVELLSVCVRYGLQWPPNLHFAFSVAIWSSLVGCEGDFIVFVSTLLEPSFSYCFRRIATFSLVCLTSLPRWL